MINAEYHAIYTLSDVDERFRNTSMAGFHVRLVSLLVGTKRQDCRLPQASGAYEQYIPVLNTGNARILSGVSHGLYLLRLAHGKMTVIFDIPL